MTRLPIEPLLEIVGRDASLRSIARQLDRSTSTISRWVRHGSIPEFDADRAAHALGLHPAEIWPIEWAEVAA